MKTVYTLVQHSASGYAGDPGFARAVEERGITNRADLARVEKAGGLILESYMEAADLVMSESYPDGYEGIYPRVRGTFARTKLDGLRVYVPERVEEAV